MKTKTIIIGLFSLYLISGSVFAQGAEKEVSVQKEVSVEEENGVKTVTIATHKNGVVTEEVYVGKEAEAKLAELMPHMEVVSKKTDVVEKIIEVEQDGEDVKKEIRKEVRMEEEDGVKTLTISTDDNGVVTEEVYVGEEADAKLAELMPQMEKVSEEVITEEEKIEVEVDDDGNLKSVTVKKSSNGEETIEVFEGEEAQKKLDEINGQSKTGVKGGKGGKKAQKKAVKPACSKDQEEKGIDN